MPGTCCTTSGRNAAVPKSKANSLAISDSCLECVFNVENITNDATLSPRKCRCTRLCFQRGDHCLIAMRPARHSHTCWPSQPPAWTPRICSSSGDMGMAKNSTTLPFSVRYAPIPYGDASQVICTAVPDCRYCSRP